MKIRVAATTIVIIGLFFVGCEKTGDDSSTQISTTESKSSLIDKSEHSSSSSFIPTYENIQGDWYVVATNPKYRGRIVTDYITYTFRGDGTVVKRTNSSGNLEVEEGTYTFDEDRKAVDVRFDLGEAGVQVTSWKQENPSKARIVYWKNITLGYERRKDELFIKQGSNEWERRGKVEVNTEASVSFIDSQALQIGKTYRLLKETPLMPEFEPADPIAALKNTKKIHPGENLTVLSVKKKRDTPWYYVQSKNAVTGNVRKGWVNSVALIGQSVQKVQ